jgi:hypothetical protein
MHDSYLVEEATRASATTSLDSAATDLLRHSSGPH